MKKIILISFLFSCLGFTQTKNPSNVSYSVLHPCDERFVSEVFINKEDPNHQIIRTSRIVCVDISLQRCQQQQQHRQQYPQTQQVPQKKEYINLGERIMEIGEVVKFQGQFYSCEER